MNAMLALMIAALAVASAPGGPANAYLEQIARTFICPEDLPDDKARQAALELFTHQAFAAGATTISEIMKLRVEMIRLHKCKPITDVEPDKR